MLLVTVTSLRPEASVCDILSGVQHTSLVSIGKLADTDYYTIFMPGKQGVIVVNGSSNNVSVTKEAVLRGSQGPNELWRVPLDDG